VTGEIVRPAPSRRVAVTVVLAYAGFILVGVSAGVSGVLLPAQISDYDVDKSTIGLTFFTFGAGFLLAGFTTGELLHRFGVRAGLLTGVLASLIAAFGLSLRPPFTVLVALGLVAGYGIGTIESVLNAYLTQLPGSTTLLNRLHGFFGVGALLGPLLAAWLLQSHAWPSVWLVVGIAWIPVGVGFAVTYATGASPAEPPAGADAARQPGLLRSALSQPAVTLAALFLAVYVGLEIGVGNWGYTYLTADRGQAELLAGYTISGYWLGLTLGRFAIGPIASRWRLSPSAINYGCVIGVAVISALAWLVSVEVAVIGGFLLLGFFLGPIFPTAMAVVPDLTQARLVATAIGVINGLSVVGGAVLPWLAGAIADGIGIWTLLPFSLVLALILLAIWWQVSRRMTVSPQP
jgi:fucose permease